MKLGGEAPELDAIDLQILSISAGSREDSARQARRAGRAVGAVGDRAGQETRGRRRHHRLSRGGRRAQAGQGCDRLYRRVDRPSARRSTLFEETVALLDDVLECHHVTGEHTLLLKVKTDNTSTLEELIRTIRSIEGVTRTETMVVLSTHTERTQITVARRGTAGRARQRPAPSPRRRSKTALARLQEGMTMHQLAQHPARARASTIPRTSTTPAASASSSTSRACARTTSCRRDSRCSTT